MVFARLVVLTLLLFSAEKALACACCTSEAQRKVEIETIATHHTDEFNKLKFRKEAKLKLGDGYDEGIKGLNDPEEDFSVAVTRQKDRYVFALKDNKGRGGNLTLILPKAVSIFEVDTRDDQEKTGYGPRLYKEWKLTGNVTGDGIFRNSAGPNRRVTLVLHGRGASCTEASDFKHWTLMVHAPKTETYTFFGQFEPLE
jgi:hypothetical protein